MKGDMSSRLKAALEAFQKSQDLLIEYEKTKNPALLPKLKSVKPECQNAIDFWLSFLNESEETDPIIRKVQLTTLSMTYRMLGGVHMYLSEYTDAKNCYESAREIGKELDDASEVVQSLNNLGTIALMQDDPAKATELFQCALDCLDGETEREFGPTLRKNFRMAKSII